MKYLVEVSFAGQIANVISDTVDLLPLCQIMFGHHAQPATAAPHPTITLEEADGHYTIHSETREDDQPTKVIDSLGMVMFDLRDRLQYLLAKDQADYLVVHAGAAIYQGKTYVYPAASGSGKTTLSAWFIGQGATLLSDELIALSPDGMVCGYAQALNVKGGGEAPFYAALKKTADELEKIEQPNGNAFVKWDAKAELNNWHKLDSFLLPKYDATCTEATLEHTSPAQTAGALLENTINLRNFERMGLPIIKQLVTSLPIRKWRYQNLAMVQF